MGMGTTEAFGIGMTIVIVLVSVLATVVPLAIVGFILYKVFKKQSETSQLVAQGEAATATILTLGETGVTINDNPQVNIALLVQRAGQPPYQVQITSTISRLAIPRVQPGMTVPVKVDPANPNRVALDLNRPIAVGAMGMMQPGMMQPGMMQPGMMQPGMMQPGAMQPGMMQPGAMQPGMMQPGAMQPGMMQPGAMQPGMMQPVAGAQPCYNCGQPVPPGMPACPHCGAPARAG